MRKKDCKIKLPFETLGPLFTISLDDYDIAFIVCPIPMQTGNNVKTMFFAFFLRCAVFCGKFHSSNFSKLSPLGHRRSGPD